MSKRVLIVEARFYDDISGALLEGAKEVLEKADCEYTVVTVPGALEIPHVISYAVHADAGFDGYVALGCIIRGETTHYDYVCQESARGLMDLGVQEHLAIGNGIITVENESQAWARARKDEKDKGGFAADTVLKMMKIREQLSSYRHG
ncbi:MAG: 6,7-dimethyl-8-ribityllumazine synthase [Hyphomonadaceae bacterium]|nr:6,7-dimethyl-8-ribityllumazine synthase [Hyphomonadaceae bacterium]MBC6411729.1 6,7-dimethyl-8-ribityllumazine synthase [Hyphomonadaceae bacterium]